MGSINVRPVQEEAALMSLMTFTLICLIALSAYAIRDVLRARRRDFYIIEWRIVERDLMERINSWHEAQSLNPTILHLKAFKIRRNLRNVQVFADDISQPLGHRNLTTFDDFGAARLFFDRVESLATSAGNPYADQGECRYFWVVSAWTKADAERRLALGNVDNRVIDQTNYNEILRLNRARGSAKLNAT
jgi:hypothetical protein